MQKLLWKMSFNLGNLEGLFVCTREDLNNIIQKRLYFREIPGKHPDISGTLEAREISLIDLDSKTVEKVSKILGNTWSGYNPFDHLSE